MKIIDLSVPLQNGVPADPPQNLVRIAYTGHDASAPTVAALFPGLRPEQLPDGKGWAVEHVTLSTHTGTHLDAPWHFHPTMNGGARAITIDEVPLDWCFRSAVKLDFRHFPDGYVASAADVETELARIGYTLAPLDIVVINTRAGSRYGEADYLEVLSPHGFRIACFPVKVHAGSAGWCRAVAILGG